MSSSIVALIFIKPRAIGTLAFNAIAENDWKDDVLYDHENKYLSHSLNQVICIGTNGLEPIQHIPTQFGNNARRLGC